MRASKGQQRVRRNTLSGRMGVWPSIVTTAPTIIVIVIFIMIIIIFIMIIITIIFIIVIAIIKIIVIININVNATIVGLTSYARRRRS